MTGIVLAFVLQANLIHGFYVEDRSNHVHGCYCEWSGESQTGGREAILAWHFLGGQYGGVELAGAKAAAVIRERVVHRRPCSGAAAGRGVAASRQVRLFLRQDSSRGGGGNPHGI